MTRYPAPVVLLLLAAVWLTGCANDTSRSASNAEDAASSSDASGSPAPAPDLQAPTSPLSFHLATGDGTVDVVGTAKKCANPDEESLSVTFTADTATVTVAASGGGGSVTVTGGPEFEGSIDSFEIGDDGSVSITGEGSESDESASPTGFAVVGSCATPSASEDGASGTGQQFTLTTRDGSISARGAATRCRSADEQDLELRFSGGGSDINVMISDGEGTVTVEGSDEFEGTVSSFQVGDDGSVEVSGQGSPADPGAEPTSFRIKGSCL